MVSIRDLRTRGRSIGSIRQITRAMEMVAATKLRRFQGRATASRPYALEISGMLWRLAGSMEQRLAEHPLFRKGPGKTTAFVLVTSDRGLCGAYNSNIYRPLEEWLRDNSGRKTDFYVYGRKGYSYLQKRGQTVAQLIIEPPLEKIDYRASKRMAKTVVTQFREGKFDEVWMLYTAFDSAARFSPTFTKLLPIEQPAESAKERVGDVIIEPALEPLLEKLIPRYLETRIYNALIESVTSEYAMRRASMSNATSAATDMQDILRKQYNRKRQETITKELLDIVGGVEALR